MAYDDGTVHHVNGVDLYVVDEGSGPCVLLLHGFPDTARVWRKQIPALVAEGYRVIAPDMRGYGRSSIPEKVDDYAVINATEDVRQLLEKLHINKAHIVGHDQGAAAAWALASFYKPMVTSLVVLSVGHPAAFAKAGLPQLAKSWYMLMFQAKGLSEKLLSANNFMFFRTVLRNEEDVDRYIEDLSRPGRLTAALNWYRANVPPSSILTVSGMNWPKVDVPTMGIYSSKDPALAEQQLVKSNQYVEGPWRYERIDEVGHWMQLDVPDVLNDLLLDFLAKSRPPHLNSSSAQSGVT